VCGLFIVVTGARSDEKYDEIRRANGASGAGNLLILCLCVYQLRVSVVPVGTTRSEFGASARAREPEGKRDGRWAGSILSSPSYINVKAWEHFPLHHPPSARRPPSSAHNLDKSTRLSRDR